MIHSLILPPLKNCERYHKMFHKLYNRNTTDVAVHFLIYDPSKNRVVQTGTSKPCGCKNKNHSIHAEIQALYYCKKYDKRNRYQIYIWKYSKTGKIKPKYSCKLCTDRFINSSMCHRIFTFNDFEKVSSIVDNPIYSLGYLN